MALDPKWQSIKDIAQHDIKSKDCNYDVFEAGGKYTGEDGLLDDIGDLRRYLFLVEDEIRSNNIRGRIEHWESEKESTTGSD